MLFEGETRIPGETFGIRTERLQETLNLDADVFVSGQPIFSCFHHSGTSVRCANVSQAYFLRCFPTRFGLHFSPPEPSEPVETPSCMPISPSCENPQGRD